MYPALHLCLSHSLTAFVYCIPVGMIQAITNQQLGLKYGHAFPALLFTTNEALSVITELIIGYALPGRPIAMMMFKTWGYITMAQALTFSSDFKLGHYMKINPRQMFWSQVVATVIAGTVQLGVQAWMFTNIPDMCSPSQPNGFIVSLLQTSVAGFMLNSRSALLPRYSAPRQSSGVLSAPHASSPRVRYTSTLERIDWV